MDFLEPSPLGYDIAMQLRHFLGIVEIRTKIVSVSTFCLGSLSGALAARRFDPLAFALAFIATLAVDMGTTAFNSYFDYLRGVDRKERNREDDKVLVHEGVEPGAALLVALGAYALAACLGLALALLHGPGLVLAGAAGMTVGFLYTGGPKPLSSTPTGELFAGGFLGTVLFLVAYWLQAKALGMAALVASAPSFFMIAAILAANNACDIEGDRAAGRRTLAIVLGSRRAVGLIAVLVLAGHLSGGLGAFLGLLPAPLGLVLLLEAPASILELRRMARRGYSHASKGPSMGGILRIFTLYTLASIAGYAVAFLRLGAFGGAKL